MAASRPARPARRLPHLATRAVFLRRLRDNAGIAGVLVLVSLAIGMIGYHWLGGLGWIDAFENASMILSGMGPVDNLTASSAKIFAGIYALYSGLALIASAGFLFTPIAHRLLHRFHLEDTSDEG